MADPLRSADPKPHTMPRWVKMFWTVVVVVALLVVLMLTGVFGEGHGPGRHLPGNGRGETPLAGDHTPPIEHGP